MRNIKLTIAYDGTGYHGFQAQKGTGLPTIQEALERVLGILTKEQVTVIGSGRTDTGVHAWGQVVNFHSKTRIPAERLPLAANSLLPPSIVVRKAEDVPPDFHARFDAVSKTYCYTIYNDRIMLPFWRNYAYHVPVALDTVQMKKACAYLEGRHDFSAFCASGTAVKNYVRTIEYFRITQEGCLLKFAVTGDGFLYNMVRIMVGTVLDVGKNKLSPEDIPEILKAQNRVAAGTTLPPQGLCLMNVEYPPHFGKSHLDRGREV